MNVELRMWNIALFLMKLCALCLCSFEPYKAKQLCSRLKKQSQFAATEKDVNSFVKADYENRPRCELRENKANLKIQP